MRRLLLCLTLCFAVAGPLFAGEPITIGETITIQSKIMDEERTLLVSTPPQYEQGRNRYPVLYMTDGNGHLTHTRGTVDFLVRNGLMPQVIIVAVANTDRTRDLTPTNAAITNDDGTEREFPTSGGSARFLDFFEKELIPYVQMSYRTEDFRIFSGHSFGGLFALTAYTTRPEMFGAVLAVSPSLQWDEDLAIRKADEFFKKGRSNRATLFVAMADEEAGDPRPNRLDRLEKVLEGVADEGFQWQVMRFPDENHGTVVLRAHYWGLRKVFDGWQLPRDPETRRFTGTIDDLEAHYAGLASRFGYEIKAPENIVNQLGYGRLGDEDVEGAIAFFEYNVSLYPESANVYDSLGEALENAGRLEDALKNYEKAVANGARNGDANLGIYTANRDRVRGELHKAGAE
jgi:predicted alpha/beta superfamily hydrolase